MNGLIGYTGFVGSNLLDQLSQPLELFNSTNISEIDLTYFDVSKIKTMKAMFYG